MRSLILQILLVVLSVIGIIWYWPLALLCTIAAALAFPILGLVLGLICDAAYGVPHISHLAIPIPFVVLALVLITIRAVAKKYFMPNGELRI